jgi:hypothetical protein
MWTSKKAQRCGLLTKVLTDLANGNSMGVKTERVNVMGRLIHLPDTMCPAEPFNLFTEAWTVQKYAKFFDLCTTVQKYAHHGKQVAHHHPRLSSRGLPNCEALFRKT